jgi:alginate O-acetyltransferase complex protein AlgI
MTTMLLGGLWHGASWTFVVWGGLHGAYLAVERLLRERFGGMMLAGSLGFRIFLALLTYALVNLTWVFFRAQDFPSAWRMLRSMLGATGGEPVLPTVHVVEVVVVIALMLIVHWTMRNRSVEDVVSRSPAWLLAMVWAGMLFAIVITQGSGDAFIYFQF